MRHDGTNETQGEASPALPVACHDWALLPAELWLRVFNLLWRHPTLAAQSSTNTIAKSYELSAATRRAAARARLVCRRFAAGIAASAPELQPAYWPGPRGWRTRFCGASTIVCRPSRRQRWGVDQDYYKSVGWMTGQVDFASEMDTPAGGVPRVEDEEHGCSGIQQQDLLPPGTCARAPMLSCFELSGCNRLDEIWLSSELSQPAFAGLRYFSLERAWLSRFEVGLRSLPNLRSLSLRNCRTLTDVSLLGLGSLLHLTALDLSFCSRLTGATVAALSTLTSLHSLSLEGCRGVGDDGLVALQPLTSITQLNLNSCLRVTSEGMAALSHLSNLADLTLGHHEKLMGARTLEYFSSLVALTSLQLYHFLHPDGNKNKDALFPLEPLTRLKHFSLEFWRPQNPHGDALLLPKTLTSLQTLNLFSCSVVELADLTSLTSLDISGVSDIGDGDISHLSVLTNLTSIRFAGCRSISDEGLSKLRPLSRLASLSLTFLSRITPHGFHNFTYLTQLSHLDLSFCRVTVEGIQHLCALSTLRVLDLSSCRDLQDGEIKAVSNIISLDTLRLKYCRGITDTGVAYLQHLSFLTDLDISYCRMVTDYGASSLARLALLTSLDLTGCPAVSPPQRRCLMKRICGLLIFDNGINEEEQ